MLTILATLALGATYLGCPVSLVDYTPPIFQIHGCGVFVCTSATYYVDGALVGDCHSDQIFLGSFDK